MTDHKAEFERWIGRLLPAGWRVDLVADTSLTGVYADVCSLPGTRLSTIRYNPEHALTPRTACHEICHILVSHLMRAAEAIADQLPEPARALAHNILDHEGEETANLMVDALLRLAAADK